MLRPPQISWAALGPILFFSLLVLLVLGRTPPPRTIIAPATALQLPLAPERPVAPGATTPTPAPLAGALLQTATLDIVTAEGLLSPAEQQQLAAALDRALQDVVQRFGTAPADRIDVYVGLEPACGLHGIAYTDVRTVQVFTCPDLPMARAVSILAHEFVHQLCHDRYGDRHLSADLLLAEGMATWGAGAYWLGDAPHFRAFVRPWLESGAALPLGESYVGRPISDMNKLYYQWASFVEFLIERDGREAFDRLYLTGQHAPASADYLAVYGRSFDELEAEWRAWVLTG
ncbi:MAG: hypothetical protein HXY37_12030 [Chloroflexi bacterium]|nr:hypothetical protein [Chloroflexota bacterium]